MMKLEGKKITFDEIKEFFDIKHSFYVRRDNNEIIIKGYYRDEYRELVIQNPTKLLLNTVNEKQEQMIY